MMQKLEEYGWDTEYFTGSGQITRTEVAHVGVRGLMQKCSVFETVPLCASHHRTGKDAHHVLGKRFEAHHGIDLKSIIESINKAFREERGE